MAASQKVRVIIVDDIAETRENVRKLLQFEADIEVIGAAKSGKEGIEFSKEQDPDVILMDIAMPNLNGIEATRQLVSRLPAAKVMALSTHSTKSVVVKMLRAGASGYMLKDSAFTELMEGIAALAEDRVYLCNKIAKVVFTDYVKMLTNPNWTGGDGLTGREREVLQLVAEGNTTKEIAKTLHLSVKTIDTHREHIMEKLGIRNIAGLTKYAVREGLTSP